MPLPLMMIASAAAAKLYGSVRNLIPVRKNVKSFAVNDFDDTIHKHQEEKNIRTEAQIRNFIASTANVLNKNMQNATDVARKSGDDLIELAKRTINKEEVFRKGHIFEGMAGMDMGIKSAESGYNYKSINTHLQGDHRSAHDIIQKRDGQIINKFQTKNSSRASVKIIKILDNPKYKDDKLIIPNEKYDAVKKALDRKATKNPEEAEHYRRMKERLIKGPSSKMARKVAKNPEEYVNNRVNQQVCKEIATDVTYAAAMAGGIEILKGIIQGKDCNEIIRQGIPHVAKASGQRALAGVIRTHGVKCAPQLKGLNSGAVATNIAAGVIDVSILLTKLAKGEINGQQFAEGIGNTGADLIVSTYFANACGLIGLTIGGPPGALAGAIIGSLAGTIISSALYNAGLDIIHRADFAKEETVRLKAFCAAAKAMEKENQELFNAYIDALIKEKKKRFDKINNKMTEARKKDDIDKFRDGTQELAQIVGSKVHFKSRKNFNDFISSDEPF